MQGNQEQDSPMTPGKFITLLVLGGLVVLGLMSMCGLMSPLAGA